MSWASYRPLTYRGRRYGQKDIQFRRCLDLPRRVPATSFEVALGDLHHAEWQTDEGAPDRAGASVADVLREAGWHVVSPRDACPDLDGYRRYIETSLGEWSAAKHGYVAGQPAWFSCRSACYLAAGRPVVVENTGFDRVLPTGEGILPSAMPRRRPTRSRRCARAMPGTAPRRAISRRRISTRASSSARSSSGR